jgi:hypothetical protein
MKRWGKECGGREQTDKVRIKRYELIDRRVGLRGAREWPEKNVVGDGNERYGSVSEPRKSQVWTKKNRYQTKNTGRNEKQV